MVQEANILELILKSQKKKDLIHNALIQTLPPGYFFGPHCHKNIELCFMQEGECDILINGQTITVHEKEFAILFPNVIHSFQMRTERSCQFLQLHFSPDNFLHLPADICQDQRFLYYIATESRQYLKQTFTPNLLSCVQRIAFEINTPQMNHIAIANLYIYELVLLLSREITLSFQELLTPQHSAVLAAVQYIRENINRKLSLDDICSACFTSKRSLIDLFKREMHVTVNDYINITKMNYAMDNIHQYTSTELAEILGFSSTQYFSTTFKKYAGVTPKQFRTLQSSREFPEDM